MESTKAIENVLAMTGGQGEASYFANSVIQMRFIKASQPLLKDFVKVTTKRLLMNKKNKSISTLRIVDTGCAVGANTLVSVGAIVDTFRTSCQENSLPITEFQAYFCDLPSNDFNTLLRTLPRHDHSLHEQQKCSYESSNFEVPISRSYHAAAVSGSHHLRLFPAKSIHFFHSSTSLHWLSRIPPQVEDRSFSAWNGDHIHISNDEVGMAYYRQFRSDMSSFLRARAEELVGGGGLFITLGVRPSKDAKQHGAHGAMAFHIEEVLKDMIAEGVIERKTLEELNIPLYSPCVEEMDEILAEHERWFERAEVKVLSGFPLRSMESVKEGDETIFGLSQEQFYRSAFHNLFSQQLDWEKDVLDEFFGRMNAKACENPNDFLNDMADNFVVQLIRKEDIECSEITDNFFQ